MNRRVSASESSVWGDFAKTVLYFRSTPQVVLDLRKPVDTDALIAVRSIGFERSFGIVTASNPMGTEQPSTVNDHLVASFQKEIAELGAVHLEVDACSPDGSHCEKSVAIALEQDSLIDLAARHYQLAIFWFDGDAFWIIPVRSTNVPLRLPAQA